MPNIGALTRVTQYLKAIPEVLSPKTTATLAEIVDKTSGGATSEITTQEMRVLRDYLRNEGANPIMRDMTPGEPLITYSGKDTGQYAYHVPDIVNDEVWYRGGAPNLKLNEPVFTTRDPAGAGWYAFDGPTAREDGVGAVGEYQLHDAKPARMRDMWQVLAEDPALRKTVDPVYQAFNPWDWLYSPEFRQAIKDRGYNSALGVDVLERGNIPVAIALSKELVKPQRRTVLALPDSEAAGRIKQGIMKPWEIDASVMQIGAPRRWTKKAVGGLAQVLRK